MRALKNSEIKHLIELTLTNKKPTSKDVDKVIEYCQSIKVHPNQAMVAVRKKFEELIGTGDFTVYNAFMSEN